MAEIDGGGLHFTSTMDNEKINASIEETLRRIQGLSDGTVAFGKSTDSIFNTASESVKNFSLLTKKSGADIDAEYKKTASSIEDALGKIGNGIEGNQSSITELTNKFNQLKQAASDAFYGKISGGDAAYRKYEQEAESVNTLIKIFSKANKELEEQEKELLKLNTGFEEHKKKLDNSVDAQKTFIAELRKVKQQMTELSAAGKEGTPEFDKLIDDAKRLQLAINDTNRQIKLLTSSKGEFLQGFASGLSGIMGGFSAVTGAVSFFAGENENLQKIMTKVQSVMAITIGLQQVSATLDKQSALNIGILSKMKNAYAASIAKSSAASVAGTVANVGLAASFRAVGAAMKAIPVFGWILAGISALIGLFTIFSSKARQAKKEQEEFNKSVTEGSKDQIASLMKLSYQWKQLGNDLESKKRFIKENGDEIKKLTGHTLDLTKADDLFIKNTGKFIEALILRSRAESKNKELQVKTAKISDIEQKLDAEYENIIKKRGAKPVDGKATDSSGRIMLDYTSQKYEKLKAERKKYVKEAEEFITEQINLTEREKKILKDLGLDAADILEGSIAAVESQLSELNKQYKNAATDKERNALLTQIKEQENLLKKLDKTRNSTANKSGKDDPFTKMLEERKKKYSEYFKWVNAGYEKEAKIEFSKTLEGGKSYKDYLQSGLDKGVLDGIKLTKEQIAQITTEIAGETNKTIIDIFKESLAEQLNNAKTVLSQLDAIQKMRDDLKDDDPLKVQKEETLDESKKQTEEKRKQEIETLKQEYADYAQQRLNIEEKFNNDKKAMYDKDGNLMKGITQSHVDEWQRQYTEALANLDNEFARTTTSIERLFGDMSEKSVAEMRHIANVAQEMLDFIIGGNWDSDKAASFGIKTEEQFKQLNAEWAKSPEKLEAIKKAIRELNNEADRSETAFNKMSAGLKKIFSSKGQNDLKTGLDMLSSGLQSVTEMGNMFADSLRNISELSGSDIFSSIADGLSQVMDVANSTMQGAQAGAMFGPAGAIIGGALGLVSSVTKIFSENKKHREELKRQIEENAQKAYFGEFEVNRLYRERYEWAKKIGEATLANIQRSGEELKNQTSANSKEQDELWKKLIGQEYKTGEHFKKTGLFGWGKGKTVTDWASLAGKTWEEIEMLAGQGKLSEEGQKYYEALKKAKDEGYDLAKRQEEYLEQVRETFTGSTYDSVVNSIIDGFKAGKRSAADFASTFKDLMQGAVESALKMAADEKTRAFYEEFANRSNDADGLTEYDIDYLNKLWNSIINSLSEESARLEQVTGIKLGDKADTSLTGAVKGVTEETASIVAGQMNAIRINQMEVAQIIRQQLLHLANIDRNTGAIDENTKFNRYIKDIYDKMSTGDSLRSQGLS